VQGCRRVEGEQGQQVGRRGQLAERARELRHERPHVEQRVGINGEHALVIMELRTTAASSPAEGWGSMKKALPPKLKKLPAAKQRRLDQLLDRNGEGTITTNEKATLERLVAEAEQLMVANAKRLADFAQIEGQRAPAGAVPVTVWIQRERAER
jgi:hypothetical protein